jgi:hypothetical protein
MSPTVALPASLLLAALCAPAGAISLADQSAAFTRGAQCAEPMPVAACLCAGLPCGVLVRLRLPVALAETASSGGAPAPGGGAGSSSLSATDNTAQAQVWSVPLRLVPGGEACWSACLPEPEPQSEAVPGEAPAQEIVPPPGCEAASPGGMALASSPSGPGPALAYASELDTLHWRTGCRDLARALLAGIRCRSGAMFGGNCLGAWGALYPRQMRDIGPDPLLHSAKTAVRAISLAHEPFRTLSFAPGPAGRLEQVEPSTSQCFRVGELPLPAPGSSPMPVRRARDGRHVWAWWHPHLCCISPQQVPGCMAAVSH